MPTPDPTATGGGPGDPEVCPPTGGSNDPGAHTGAAPNLPETSTAERAGQVIGTAGFPFLMFALGLVAWELVNRRRRARQELSAYALAVGDPDGEVD